MVYFLGILYRLEAMAFLPGETQRLRGDSRASRAAPRSSCGLSCSQRSWLCPTVLGSGLEGGDGDIVDKDI